MRNRPNNPTTRLVYFVHETNSDAFSIGIRVVGGFEESHTITARARRGFIPVATKRTAMPVGTTKESPFFILNAGTHDCKEKTAEKLSLPGGSCSGGFIPRTCLPDQNSYLNANCITRGFVSKPA